MHPEPNMGFDLPTTSMVTLALIAALTACWFGFRFSKAIGGELGAAFKWVMGGTLLFAVTRVDDLIKVSGVYDRMGIVYRQTMWFPHSTAVFVSWFLITFGFYKMAKTFSA
jgi:hypothetical protein